MKFMFTVATENNVFPIKSPSMLPHESCSVLFTACLHYDRSWLNLTDDLDGALSSMHISPAAGALLIDKPVLARRTSDGLYYNGRVKSQVSILFSQHHNMNFVASQSESISEIRRRLKLKILWLLENGKQSLDFHI